MMSRWLSSAEDSGIRVYVIPCPTTLTKTTMTVYDSVGGVDRLRYGGTGGGGSPAFGLE